MTSFHRLVQRVRRSFNQNTPIYPFLERVDKTTYKLVNSTFVVPCMATYTYGNYLCNIPYVTIRITRAQMKVIKCDREGKVKLNYSKPLCDYANKLFNKSDEDPELPYVMFYTNEDHIFVEIKTILWQNDGVLVTYRVL